MIVDRIKALADAKNITFAAIERCAGLSQGSIRKWNTSIPSGDKLLRVADLLDTTVDFLLTGKEKKEGTMLMQEPKVKSYSTNSADLERAMEYYKRLNTENQDYIKGEMVRLIKEQDKGNDAGLTKSVAK